MEQLNIEGKRSGQGFVAHKATLVNALSRALADRVMLLDITIGRKGILGYLKALGGSNIVKVIPSNGSASEAQTNGHKRLRVICGANTSYLADGDFIGDKTPLTFSEVRVCPSNTVMPNLGVNELAEALNRVLPFTAKDDNRPVLQCVNFEAKDGKLTLVSADGFRLAIVTLDCEGEGQALVNRDDLKGIANALRRAKRVRISFEGEDVTKTATVIVDTELTRYKWQGVEGKYPEWQKLVPTEFVTVVNIDTVEAIKAVNSLKALSDNPKAYPIDLTIGEGKVVMANPDDKGQAELSADTDGEVIKVRIDGQYLVQVLKALGGMVELKLTNGYSPVLFSHNGYKLVVMPMMTTEATEQMKRNNQEKAEATPTEGEPTEPEATEQTEVEPSHKPKKEKRNRVKEPSAAK